MRSVTSVLIFALVLFLPALGAAQVQTPEQYFGFKPGADGELASYPKFV